jgi:hypothetical protein
MTGKSVEQQDKGKKNSADPLDDGEMTDDEKPDYG